MTGTEQKNSKPTEDAYRNCIRCGLCLAVCPTYAAHLTETASPRGRVALARKGLEGDLRLSPNLFGQMYSCFDCMACNDICPVGIKPADLALQMRQHQEALAPASWKEAVFGKLLPYPDRLEWATLPMRLYEHLGLRRLVHALGVMRVMPETLRDWEAMLPRIPQRPLRRVLPEIVPAAGPRQQRVGFFLGCAQSLLFAEDSRAAVRVLARHGCEVVTPRQVACCGMPAVGYGREDLVADMARRNIAAFERAGVETIVTDCATCGATLKTYGALLAGDPAWAARAAAFSRRVRDIQEFLATLPPVAASRMSPVRVTYHDPCHLRRGQQIWKEPRQLLQGIEGAEFVELPEADWCCGSAGSQLITHHDTSLRVLERKIDNVASTGAEILATGCPGCRMQLSVGVKRRGLPVRVVHPVSLLDEVYRGGSKP